MNVFHKISIGALLALLLSSVSYGQRQGVIVTPEGKPVDNASVSLWRSPSDSTVVERTSSNDKGLFTLQQGDTGQPLRIECIGYTPLLVLLTGSPADTIVMRPQDVAIQEVRVGASNVVYKDRQIHYYNTPSAVASSLSGAELIEKLNVASLYYDQKSRRISVIGGGKLQILLNGIPSSQDEVLAIPPHRVQRIEHHDAHSAEFPEADVVINYVVELPPVGGSAFLELWNGLTTIFGEDNFSLRIHAHQHVMRAFIGSQFRNTHTHRVYNHEVFKLPSGEIERHEDPVDAKFAYLRNRGYLQYRWAHEQHLAAATISARHAEAWHSDFAGTTTERNTATGARRSYRFDERNARHELLPTLSADYRHATKVSLLSVNLFAGRGEETLLYARSEQPADAVGEPFRVEQRSGTIPTQFGGQARYSYGFVLGNAGVIVPTIRLQHTTEQFVRKSQEAVGSQVERSNSLLLASLNYQIGPLDVNIFLPTRRLGFGGLLPPQYRFAPQGDVSFRPFPAWKLKLQYYTALDHPSTYMLNAAQYWLTPYLRTEGNATLSPYRTHQLSLRSDIRFPNGMSLVLLGMYQHQDGMPSAYHTLLKREDGSHFVNRRYENSTRMRTYTAWGSLRIPLFDMFRLRLYGAIQRYDIARGDQYRAQRWVPSVEGELNFMYMFGQKYGLEILYNLWYGGGSLAGEMLTTEGIMQQAEAKWLFMGPRIALSLGVNAIGSREFELVRNLSPIVQSQTIREARALINMPYVRLVWAPSWGKEADDQQSEDADVDLEKMNSTLQRLNTRQ